MGFLSDLFTRPPYPPHQREEVQRLMDDLFKIGKKDDFLSERPGPPFNSQCRHTGARSIGKRLHDIGGLPLMEYAHKQVKRKLGKDYSAHLEYCWSDIGDWKP